MLNEKCFVVIIIHQHSKEVGTMIGKINALNRDDAWRRSEVWRAQKRAEHKCKKFGNRCLEYVDEPNRSQKTLGLNLGAKEIEPQVLV